MDRHLGSARNRACGTSGDLELVSIEAVLSYYLEEGHLWVSTLYLVLITVDTIMYKIS